MFSDEELMRYSRQIMLPELDVAGQEKLRQSSVLVAGLGGLGSPVSLYLAAAGVGTLILVDHDQVDLSNLQRQIAHDTTRVGGKKVESAAAAIQRINPHCNVITHAEEITPSNGQALVEKADLIVDCSDNFSLRFLLNRLSVKNKITLVSGAAIRMDGQISVYDPKQSKSPCYNCLFDEAGEDDRRCATNGVLAPIVGVVGSIQATEAIKSLTGVGTTLVGRLLIFDGLNMQFREIKMKPNPACPTCGT